MKLSVVIPVYNTAEYLEKCLLSVLSPGRDDERDYEMIIVNDGSTDASGSIAESYEREYPGLIRVVTTENHGLGSARNEGIAAARGEYLYFIDSDDYLAPGAMDELLASLTGDFDICFFDSVAVSVLGKELKYIRGCACEGEITLDAFPELLLEWQNVWNKVFRRELFRSSGVRFPGRAWFEDLRTVPKLYLYAEKMRYIPRPWHRYLIRPGSITNTNVRKIERNLEIVDAVDDLIGFYKERGRYEALSQVLEYVAFHSIFLTSTVRVNLADRKSPVQERLMESFLSRFPRFRDNPYIQRMGLKHRLLTSLLLRKRFLAVHLIMKLNNLLKGKHI